MGTAKNNFWDIIWEKRKVFMAILLVISLVAGSIFGSTSFNLFLNAIENVRREESWGNTASRVREKDPLEMLDDTDDSGCLHVFDEAWAGFECKISDYNSEYALGDEIRLKIRFSKAVPNQVSTVVGGEWTTYQGTEKVFEKTFVPEMDYLLIQVTDLQKYKTVGIDSIEVTVTQKAAVAATEIPVHSRRNYVRKGHYLLYSGSYNGSYGTDDLWLSYCDDTDYLTLVYDCNSAEQTEWSVLGWGGSLRGNWIGGPTYATGARSGMEEVTVQVSVRFIRRMMGLSAGDQLEYMALGTWNGGRIKSLTLHRGYQMERSPELFTGGEANESWRCTDIEQILDAPDDSYIYVRYTCTGAKVPGAYVLGWGAGVNGGWATGRSYKIEGLAAGREYTVGMRMDEFRRSLGLGWNAKIDSLILSAYNNGKILAVWISPEYLEGSVKGGAWAGGAQNAGASFESTGFGGSGGSGSSGGSGGASGGSGGHGGNGDDSGKRPGGNDGEDNKPVGYKPIKYYRDEDPNSKYNNILSVIENGKIYTLQEKYYITKKIEGFDKEAGYYRFHLKYTDEGEVSKDDKEGDWNGLQWIWSNFGEGSFLVVEYSGNESEYPVLYFGTSRKYDPYFGIYGDDRLWATVEPIYVNNGKAVFSYASISRAINGGKVDDTIIDFLVVFAQNPSVDSKVYIVKDENIGPEPIIEMEVKELYETSLTQYYLKALKHPEMNITVRVTFDKEVEARLWMIYENGGEFRDLKENTYEYYDSDVEGYVYQWEVEIPKKDYLGIVVDKVIEGGKAKILDISIELVGLGRSLDRSNFNIDMSEYEAGRKAKVTLTVDDEEAHAAEGLELMFKAGNEGTAITDGDGKAVLNVVVPEEEMKITVPGGRNVELKDVSVEMMDVGYGTIEKGKPLSIDLAEVVSDSGYDYEAGANAEITHVFDDGWGNPVKDPGLICSLGEEKIAPQTKSRTAVLDLELPENEETNLSIEASGIPEGESIRLVSVSAEVEKIAEPEGEEIIGTEFTDTYISFPYLLEKVTDLSETVEVTLCFADEQGDAAEGVGVQISPGLAENIGTSVSATTDEEGCAVLKVELPQIEGDKIFLYICVTDMAGYDKVILQSISIRSILSGEEETEEDETTNVPVTEGLYTFTAESNGFGAPLSDYCGYEPGGKAGVTLNFLSGTGDPVNGAWVEIGVGDTGFSGEIADGKVTVGDVSLEEGTSLNIVITDMAGYESIVLTSIEAEMIQEENPTEPDGNLNPDAQEQDVPDSADGEEPEDETLEPGTEGEENQMTEDGDEGENTEEPDPAVDEVDGMVPGDSSEDEDDDSSDDRGDEATPYEAPDALPVEVAEPLEAGKEDW